MTRIKVCGLMNRSDLSSALSGGVDAVGFVVEIDGSRHRISSGEAADLIDLVPVFTKSVAVIAPDSVDDALRLAKITNADILQVHGSLSPDDMAKLRSRVHQNHRKLVAAVAAGSKDFPGFAHSADALLIDTMVDGKLGGTGAVHDWNRSAEIVRTLNIPVILAGGLNPGNVAEAVMKVRPYAVDVSSGTETGGKKDLDKIRSFVNEVRSCSQQQQ